MRTLFMVLLTLAVSFGCAKPPQSIGDIQLGEPSKTDHADPWDAAPDAPVAHPSKIVDINSLPPGTLAGLKEAGDPPAVTRPSAPKKEKK